MNSYAFSIKLWLAEGHQIGHFEAPQKTTPFSIKTFHKFVTFWSDQDQPHFDVFVLGVHANDYYAKHNVFQTLPLKQHHQIFKIIKTRHGFSLFLENSIGVVVHFCHMSKLILRFLISRQQTY